MKVYTPTRRTVTPKEAYAQAAAHCQAVFGFRDATKCTALMLWSVLVWAAARTKSLSHAVERLYPGLQDQTFWNLLRRSLSKRSDALERRLNELLRLPAILPRLAGRVLTVAVDYHAVPYYGAPKKVAANCVGARANEAPVGFTPTPPSAWSWPAGGTRWP
jgi:hypothetical protein